MNKQIRALMQRKAKLVAEMRTLVTASEATEGVMTEEQTAQFEQLRTQVEALNGQIEREELIAANEVASGVQIADDARIEVSDNRAADPRRGWQSFGEFAQAVRAGAARGGGRLDERLMIGAAVPSTFGNEAGGQDGGFLVPPEFSTTIFTLSLEEDALLPMTDGTPIGGNSMVFPKDETTPWGTDGVRAYWQAEATQATATKPKLGVSAQRLHKLMALVPVTDELLDDATALAAYLPGLTARSIRWKTDESILFGTGAGQPLGLFQSKAVIVQAKETGQATNTLLPANISNMVSRLLTGSYRRAVWLINPDVLPALDNMTLGNYPIYMPVGGGSSSMAASPYGMLKGRPVILTEHASAFSAQSDVSLIDLSYYRSITSRSGVQTATSMHLYFDADATAFRTTFRVDGAPKLENPVTPPKSNKTRSPFVTLAAR
ncbi:phage major capsid protein [Burkholderia pseudomallei]|nr:phage major capsid protein [Burkholderia pseudomallei]MBF3975044.1 phage major capsid protein [Burkholderia pseudomallei]